MDSEDPVFHNHLVQVVGAIGGYETSLDASSKKTFIIGDQCIECLRDLKRYLRRDDQTPHRTAFKLLGKLAVLQTALIPILVSKIEINNPQRGFEETKNKIILGAIELMVPLTWPINEAEVESVALELEVLRQYKEAFLKDNVIEVIMSELISVLSTMETQVITEKETTKELGKIRLILSLFRNLLAIRDVKPRSSSSAEIYLRSTLQERIIMEFEKHHVIDLLMSFIATIYDPIYGGWKLLLLECVYWIFVDRDPSLLANV
ncbi:Topoisomerase 1-associated factor 1, partial [Nowakowskiella sp. JEL0078]